MFFRRDKTIGSRARAARVAAGISFVVALVSLAQAHGPVNPLALFPSAMPDAEAPVSRAPAEDARPAPRKRAVAAVSTAVCVRLCDGFYFPVGNTAGGDAACASQCPDAPTALYTRRPGSDKIEDAVSLLGEKYTDLASAGRHLTSVDNTCTCHNAKSDGRMSRIVNDPTLRKGDMVMTTNGLVVFEGGKSGLVEARDFVPVAKAPNVSKENRETLLAIDRAGPSDRQTSTHSGGLTPPPPAPKPKGKITVDDAPAEVSAK